MTTKVVPQAAQNTDRELWRERDGDYYADSIHVTDDGRIGINCGGLVFVKPVREWHKLAKDAAPAPEAPADDLVARLRGWKHAAIRRDGSTLGIMREAADEIERLRHEVAEAHGVAQACELRAERAEEKIRRMEGKAAKWYEDEIDKMRYERDALREDAERIDWLQSYAGVCVWRGAKPNREQEWLTRCEGLRAAIDAARKEAK